MSSGYAFTSRTELDQAIELFVFNETSAADRFGNISNWDVSAITDFSILFESTIFNSDISSWDVSSGTDFSYMFYEADSFNGDISRWDVSSVTEFNAMFYGAKSLYICISLIEFFGCLG